MADATPFFITLWSRYDISNASGVAFCVFTNEKISRENGYIIISAYSEVVVALASKFSPIYIFFI
jgi:hypothetical protein